MLTDNAFQWLRLVEQADGIRTVAHALQPTTLGARPSPAYRKALRLLNQANDRAADAWAGLTRDERDAVQAKYSRLARALVERAT